MVFAEFRKGLNSLFIVFNIAFKFYSKGRNGFRKERKKILHFSAKLCAFSAQLSGYT